MGASSSALAIVDEEKNRGESVRDVERVTERAVTRRQSRLAIVV